MHGFAILWSATELFSVHKVENKSEPVITVYQQRVCTSDNNVPVSQYYQRNNIVIQKIRNPWSTDFLIYYYLLGIWQKGQHYITNNILQFYIICSYNEYLYSYIIFLLIVFILIFICSKNLVQLTQCILRKMFLKVVFIIETF